MLSMDLDGIEIGIVDFDVDSFNLKKSRPNSQISYSTITKVKQKCRRFTNHISDVPPPDLSTENQHKTHSVQIFVNIRQLPASSNMPPNLNLPTVKMVVLLELV